ncbi:MAG: DUF3368 domain-containing protein [Nitrospinae bacterium]|nr:DUF3368 domain-containing protein [Nitrospinota bacterium]
MSGVSNTGPLIALAKVDRLGLLERLFDQVHLPPAVYRELLAKAGREVARLEHALATFIHVTGRPRLTPVVQEATLYLDPGEQEAIALAHEMGLPLLMDDRLGRQAARRLNLVLTGVAGVLIQSKAAGLIPQVRPVLAQMREYGYWLSDELLDVAAQLAGESAPEGGP